MRGGVADAEALPQALARELYVVGNRPGQYQGFLSLLAHERDWPRAREEYSAIKIPTLLIYGEQDWSPAVARETERGLLLRSSIESVGRGGHFLALDQPQELSRSITEFANESRAAMSGIPE
jgi:pimeloyl-ACP methyl ester carboxylesterase